MLIVRSYMKYWACLLALLLAPRAALSALAVCEPSPPVQKILLQADAPRHLATPLAQHRQQLSKVIEQALIAHPDDPFLHQSLQNLALGRNGSARLDLIAKYEKLLAEKPTSPARQYALALILYSAQTSRAIHLLEQVLKAEPQHGPALLLRARIHTAKSFEDIAKVKQSLTTFHQACPETPAVFPELAWLPDVDFLREHAARTRAQLDRRSDLLALQSYTALWHMEKNSTRSDQRNELEPRWTADVRRIRGDAFPRSESWLGALWGAEFLLSRKIDGIQADFRRHFPHAWPSVLVDYLEAAAPGPTPEAFKAIKALADRYPASTGLGSFWISLARQAKDDGHVLADAFIYMKAAMDADPEGYLTSPPMQIEMATELVRRRIRLDLVAPFVFTGLSAGATPSASDLYPDAQKLQTSMQEAWRLFGFFPLIEAYVLQKKSAEAKDVLLQARLVLDRSRPPADALPADLNRFALLEARYWALKGSAAEADNRKFDALIAYRNALATYPAKSARGDDNRDQILASAQRIAKELGATAEAWTDWEAKQPLTGFRTGVGGPNAWRTLVEKHPATVVTEMHGRDFAPETLTRKVTFVSLWATWCGPCREELPFLQKLADRFKARDDIAVIALNVDEDPAVVPRFLDQFKFTFRSTLASRFAYDMLPVFSIPANYLITPDKTTYFEEAATGEGWIEKAAAAIDTALKTAQPERRE
ncbi:MAG: redoxin family protein [Bryobacterales bacterium]|nr:redoxin family protein [Bryobacterales bacterium]